MSGNEAKVRIDLNFPRFQDDLFDLDTSDIKRILKTLKKLRGLTWNQLFKDKGLRWEEVHSIPEHYTIRLSQSYRAVVIRDGAWMRFISLHLDHDGAYGKK